MLTGAASCGAPDYFSHPFYFLALLSISAGRAWLQRVSRGAQANDARQHGGSGGRGFRIAAEPLSSPWQGQIGPSPIPLLHAWAIRHAFHNRA